VLNGSESQRMSGMKCRPFCVPLLRNSLISPISTSACKVNIPVNLLATHHTKYEVPVVCSYESLRSVHAGLLSLCLSLFCLYIYIYIYIFIYIKHIHIYESSATPSEYHRSPGWRPDPKVSGRQRATAYGKAAQAS